MVWQFLSPPPMAPSLCFTLSLPAGAPLHIFPDLSIQADVLSPVNPAFDVVPTDIWFTARFAATETYIRTLRQVQILASPTRTVEL